MFKERLKTHHSAMAEVARYTRGPRKVSEFLNVTLPDEAVSKKATIYIHVPFCSKICSFCNMRRSLQSPRENYHTLLIEEMKAYKDLDYIKNLTFDAIYFGGGTPTTLNTEALREVLRALREYFNLSADVEITIETTVTELTDEKLQMFKEEGVTRFSVGVQTFNDEGRKLMGRIGSGETAYEKLKQMKDMGFKTLSMDLIYNYPGQSKEDLEEDLDKIIALDLDGFSMYSLIDMKATTIEDAQGINQDTLFFDIISEKMKKAGYRFLELTKMVTRDQYKYVMNRHEGMDTLPLGAGAGGSVGGLMLMNPINLDQYEESIKAFGARNGMLFSPAYRDLAIFKGTLQKGYLPEDISVYIDLAQYEKTLLEMLEKGYIEKEGSSYHFTSKGIFWGNNISRLLYDMRVQEGE
ncbi:coproporphyrinogen-III oxidase family protein [Zhenhengia yiwuensis]|jgi:coproporphyrinogen III oxidase-like Fe-S oxidoreductase|uniref:coproporphyrinogen-III oxidase family protein n=1 Tax=Zhenhengia yiwuensis TaxID=2763666 RepID=UPI002A751419|nr:coproporphyrinogen-III oxidase family protein [Zhenhengia yiwuensis]MDY3368759.1 coproporphyrinogen-III oxidase family protein [Zhenhengia yiwuensis]